MVRGSGGRGLTPPCAPRTPGGSGRSPSRCTCANACTFPVGALAVVVELADLLASEGLHALEGHAAPLRSRQLRVSVRAGPVA
eukprot:7879346-Pyramimonas_sp.AAC.1